MATNIVAEHEVPSPNFNLVHSQTSTLEQILGNEEPRIKDPLRLLAATVDVSVFESREDLFYRVTFPEYYLSGRKLSRLLSGARKQQPKFNQDRLGILDDWILPDEIDKDSIKRVDRHKEAFDPYWTEFDNYHRKSFMAAIKALTQRKVENFFNLQAGRLVTKEQAISNLPELINDLEVPYILYNNYDLLENYPQALLGVSKERLWNSSMLRNARSIITRTPKELREILIDKGILKYDRIVVDLDGPPGHVDAYFRTGGGNNSDYFNVEYLGEAIVKFRLFGSWMKLSFDGEKFNEVDRYIQDESDVALSPLLVWSRDKATGKRSYISSEIPYELLKGVDRRANSLIGLLAATATSPKQRDQLPERLGYKEGGYIAKIADSVCSFSELNARLGVEFKSNGVSGGQPIMEAQIPLPLLMYANILMNEIPLFPRVEALHPK